MNTNHKYAWWTSLFIVIIIIIIIFIKTNNLDYTLLIIAGGTGITTYLYIKHHCSLLNRHIIEIIMFDLTLLGLFFTFNSNILLDSEDCFIPFKRMFTKENTLSFSKFTNDTIKNNNSHIVIVLDESGSTQTKTNTERYNQIYKALNEKVQNHTHLFGKLSKAELNNFFNIPVNKDKKSTIFKLRALDFIRLLDSMEYPGNLSLILFNEYATYYPIDSKFNDGIKYIAESDPSGQNTNFVKLFQNINKIIFKQFSPHNVTTSPQYVFIFLTDFLHDPEDKTNMEEQKNTIREELKTFSTNSTFANFYYFYEDTICPIASKKQFSIFELIKHTPYLSTKLIPIQNFNEIEFGHRKTQFYLPLYYVKPYTYKRTSKVKISFDSLQYTHCYRLCLNTESHGNDQYYLTLKNKKNPVHIGKYPYEFSVDKGDCIEITYQGYVSNQYPSQSITIKDMNTRKSYEVEIIFFRDFSNIAKYIFNLLLVFITLDLIIIIEKISLTQTPQLTLFSKNTPQSSNISTSNYGYLWAIAFIYIIVTLYFLR